MSSFIHLHTHSHYSLLDGLSQIDDLVAKAAAYEMPALAITDHGNLYGAIDFYKKAKKAGIKPIIGVEAYIAARSRRDKQPSIDSKRYHLTLLAQNLTGYKNLVKLVTRSNLEGYYYKPRMDKELLREYAEGIICLSGCFGGEVARALRDRDNDRAEEIAREYRDIFGKERYFLEIMHHPKIEGLDEVRGATIALGKKLGIPVVGTQDSHYPSVDQQRAHGILIAVQTNSDLADTALFGDGEDFSFIDTATALARFHDIPEAVTNTERVAEMCDIALELGRWVFPEFSLPSGVSSTNELRRLALHGIVERRLEDTAELRKRLDYELRIIDEKRFAPYFLVVADLLRFARSRGILTNTRGSAAGSLVTYLSGITNVNPIEYHLPFERFLNPERPSAPDIDMDFADNRRDEVIQYAREKYGEDRVAQIGTFGTMHARGSVRDVARALGYPYNVGDRISRLIPFGSQGFPMTIEKAMEMTPELRAAYETEPLTKEVVDIARRLEGSARHISVHAAGVVITPKPLEEFVPLQLDPKGGKIITQYDMHAIEDIGLLKLDFLGIRNLTILSDSVRLVKQLRQKDIDIERIPFDDRETFSLIARGETSGLFQLNGDGMTRYLKELQPTTIHDINAMVALYRPGPIAFIPDYIERKRNPQLVTYLDARLKEILEPTFGILIYQDDLLLIANRIAGYSWGETDKFRKAVGKKIPEEMRAQKEKFIAGCLKSGMDKEKVQKLWGMIETFAAYGFNKAHAASYGRVAYQTAYMKAHFPIEYMTAILSAEAGDIEKVGEIIAECARMGIDVLPPDINESEGDFTIITAGAAAKETIRFGLYSIKNVGTEIADAMIAERKSKGSFVSFSNMLERIRHRNLNKKSLESLIMAGALDTLGERGQLLANLEDALLYNREVGRTENQASLFGLMDDRSSAPQFRLKPAPPATIQDRLRWEKELIGLYISGHPFEQFRTHAARFKLNIASAIALVEGTPVLVAGIVEQVRHVTTKNAEAMLFLRLADQSGAIETVVFPRTLQAYRELFEEDRGIVIKGRISERNGQKSIVCDEARTLA